MRVKKGEIGGTKDLECFKFGGNLCLFIRFGGTKHSFFFSLVLRFHYEVMKTGCVSENNIMYKTAFVNVVFKLKMRHSLRCHFIQYNMTLFLKCHIKTATTYMIFCSEIRLHKRFYTSSV